MPSARDVAFIGCRLLAVYALYSLLLYLGQWMLFIVQALRWPNSGNGQFVASYGLSGAILLAMFLALWFRAGWIAGKIAAGTGDSKAAVPGSWSRESVLSLALVVLGVWILVHHVPDLVAYAVRILPSEPDPDNEITLAQWAQIVSAGLTTVLGLFCLLGARGIAEAIGRFRRW